MIFSALHSRDEPLARLGQPRAAVGRAGEAERDTVAEDRRAATRPARASAGPPRARGAARRDPRRSAPLLRNAGSRRSCRRAIAARISATDRQMASAPVRSIHSRCPIIAVGDRLRRRRADQVRQRQVIGGRVHDRLVIGRIVRLGRGDVDREEAAREAASLHPGQVEMALALALQPDRLAVRRIAQKPQEEVVMAVEYRDHGASVGV